jgi:predicted secreted protein
MAKAPGRSAVVSKNAVVLGGVRVSNISVDNTPIDVTDQDSVGLQELLSVASMRVLTFDVEGVYKNPTLRDIAMDPVGTLMLTDMTFKFSDALSAKDTIGGNFFMLNYKEGNDYKEATTFSASFTSSGTWTFS